MKNKIDYKMSMTFTAKYLPQKAKYFDDRELNHIDLEHDLPARYLAK